MKFLIITSLLFFAFFSNSGFANGIVCLGRDLSKVRTKEPYWIKVNNKEPIKLLREGGGIITNLPTNKRIRVTVLFENNPLESWWLDFRNFDSKAVKIWRAAGSWRMEKTNKTDCIQN